MLASMDEPPRLKTKLWVQAQLRLCDLAAIPFAVVRRGDPDAGAVLIKLDRGADGLVVLARGFGGDGQRIWLRATGDRPVSQSEADSYLARQVAFDPDLWILEIEDATGVYQPDGQKV